MDTWTLGQLIDALEDCKQDASVEFDFCGLKPTTVCSWRGSYEYLALNWDLSEYYGGKAPNRVEVKDLLKTLKGAIGSVYSGWKGGEYGMTRLSKVWVDNCGVSTTTAITGIQDEDYHVKICTQYREYEG